MYKLCLSFCCLLLVLHANAQERKWQFGLGLDVFQAKLVNISKDYDMQFHSVPYYTQYDYGGISPGIHVIRQLNERWSLKTGLNFIRHQSKFHFVYTDYFGLDIDTTLHNQYSYLVVPLIARYKLMQWKNSQLTIGAGFLNKILWNYDSNFPEINHALVMLFATARTFVVASRIEAAYEWYFANHSSIGLGIFLSRDLTSYLPRYNVGFMDNLKSSRYQFGGIGLTYMF